MAASHSEDESDKRPEDDPQYDWLRPPGLFCDAYTANYFPDSSVVRVSFGEWIGRGYLPIYRTAVVLPVNDARQLGRTLLRLAREAEEEAAKKQPKEPGEPTSSET